MATALETIPLKVTTIMPILLLQKPAKNSTARDLTTCLQHRLNTLRKSDQMELLCEEQTLQKRIPKIHHLGTRTILPVSLQAKCCGEKPKRY